MSTYCAMKSSRPCSSLRRPSTLPPRKSLLLSANDLNSECSCDFRHGSGFECFDILFSQRGRGASAEQKIQDNRRLNSEIDVLGNSAPSYNHFYGIQLILH